MITVIHIRDSAFVGGPEKQILGQSAGLDRDRFEPLIVSFSTKEENALTEAAMSEGLLTECLPDGKLSLPYAVGRLRGLIRRSVNPVVVTSGFKADFTAQLACRCERVPWIGWFHGFTGATSRVRAYEALDLRTLRHARCVIALCNRTAEHLRSRDIRNVIIVPNGIDVAFVQSVGDRESARAELGIGMNEAIIGVVSRLSIEKGIDVFINSVVEVLRKHPNARFPIIGDGPMRAALQRQAKDLGVADRIIFTGLREDAVGLMKAFDVFVLPSLRENLPVALLEAMACGVCVVATDVGGVNEVLNDTLTQPVQSGSSSALTEAIVALIDDANLREERARFLLKRVQDFSFDRHVDAIEPILENACGLAAPATRTEAAPIRQTPV